MGLRTGHRTPGRRSDQHYLIYNAKPQFRGGREVNSAIAHASIVRIFEWELSTLSLTNLTRQPLSSTPSFLTM